jgi:hypothetical protein
MAMRRVCPKDGSDTAALSRIATAMRAEGSLRSMGSLAFGGAQRFGVCFVPYRCKLRAGWKGKCLLSSAPPPDGELGRRWLCFSGLGAWRNICSGVRPATPINGRTYISALSRTAAAYIHQQARGQILMPSPPQYWQRYIWAYQPTPTSSEA